MNLDIEVSPLLKANVNATERIVVNQGGTSSGKTYAILQALVGIMYREKGLLISVVSESLPHLRRGALRDFVNILLEAGIYSERRHHKSNNSFQIGGSVIEFFGADQPDKLRGARRDYLFINECNNVSKSAFDQLEVRTKHRIFLDFNPVSEFWVHEHILPQDNVKFIQSTYKDNPFLDEQIIKAIERRKETDPEWFKVFGEGRIGNVQGVVFPNWKQVDEMPDRKDCKFWCVGLDFGYTNDPTAAVLVALHNGELYLDELFYSTGMMSEDIHNALVEKITTNTEIIADSADPRLIDEIKRLGRWYIRGVKKGKIEEGITLVKKYKMNVTKTSTNLIKELRNYRWKEDKDGGLDQKPIDEWNHACDAFRYAVISKAESRGQIYSVSIS